MSAHVDSYGQRSKALYKAETIKDMLVVTWMKKQHASPLENTCHKQYRVDREGEGVGREGGRRTEKVVRKGDFTGSL